MKWNILLLMAIIKGKRNVESEAWQSVWTAQYQTDVMKMNWYAIIGALSRRLIAF